MSESLQAAYVRDGFYIHDAAVWPLDAVDRAVEGMDAVRRGERELSPLSDATRQWPQSCCGVTCAPSDPARWTTNGRA